MRLGAWELDSVQNVDALTLLKGLPAGSVDLIATDPPFNIGKADWDSWATLDDYLAWLDDHLREFKRVLKPNGSLYLFCATKYQAEVHMTVKRHLNVLNNIRWRKENGWHKKAAEEDARQYFPASETVIFAEQWGADAPYGDALIDGNSTYWQACETAKVSVFGDYLLSEFTGAGVTRKQIAALFPSRTGGMTGCVSNWLLGLNVPTPEQYQRMRDFLNNASDGDYLRREYEDLRREYEDLRREYEDLRRPFYATADAPYTDVWDFATVNTYPGKHLCEKPLDMCQHIVRVSSRKGAVVLDPFCGSGNLLRAAFIEGRHYLGGDSDAHWSRKAADWIPQPFDVPLFADAAFAPASDGADAAQA